MLHRQARLFYKKARPLASFCHVGDRLWIETRSTRSIHTAPIRPAPFANWSDPRQCIVDTDNPGGMRLWDVLACLSNFWPPESDGRQSFKRRRFRSPLHNEAVVILATPSFARWLEDDREFIPGVLQHLVPYGNPVKNKGVIPSRGRLDPPSDFDVDVFCACVDGLPPDIEWIKSRNATYTREGFAFLHGRTGHILPNLWPVESSSKKEDEGGLLRLPTPPSITFASYQNRIPNSPLTEAVVPPANTLFVNGKESTMFASKWHFNDHRLGYQKVRSQEKQHQVINVFGRRLKTGFRPGYIPTIPLTPPRRIKSGLGNIIRELVFDGGVVSPASKELEANFNEYMSKTDGRHRQAGVWALITPSKIIPYKPYKLNTYCLTSPEGVKSLWGKSRWDIRFIGAWVNRGAKLCKIVGGGGGWGIGGGLLSLDPQVTPGSSGISQFDNQDLSDNPLETDGLAKPGSYVQFFIAPEQTPPTVREPPAKKTDGPAGQYLLTAIGSIPKNVDRVPEAGGQADNIDSTASSGIKLRPGIFGAVSESGFFIRTCKTEGRQRIGDEMQLQSSSVQSKIDYPHAYVYRKFNDVLLEDPSAEWNIE